MKRIDEFFFAHRNVLAGAPLVYALVSTRWEWERSWVVWPLTLMICSLGVALRTWASSHCAYAQGRAKDLTTTGPYAYVRNPLYVGNLLILTGATIASELAWLLPVALAWACVVYGRVTRHEERRLFTRYGDRYLQYRDQVPAWLPRLPRICGLSLRAVGRECLALLVLLPFVIKELNVFGLWLQP